MRARIVLSFSPMFAALLWVNITFGQIDSDSSNGSGRDLAPQQEEDQETLPPNGEPTEETPLDLCHRERRSLAGLVVMLRQRLADAAAECTATAHMQETLDLCTEDLTQQRRTNIALNSRLEECEAQEPEPMPPGTLTELETARTALAEAEAQVAALTDRLNRLGYSAESGFFYAGGNPATSFVRNRELNSLLGNLPRLDPSACGAAQEWLMAQQGPNMALRRVIWVWQGDQPLLCVRGVDGDILTIEPPGNAEAHAIVFQ